MGPRFGRFAEPALWILAVLDEGPRASRELFDEIRRRDGDIGPGTLFGAITRLEAAALIDRRVETGGVATYRRRAARS